MMSREITEVDSAKSIAAKVTLKQFQSSELRRINGFVEYTDETCLHMYWENLNTKLIHEWKGEMNSVAYAVYMEEGIQAGYSRYVVKGYMNFYV